MHLDCHYQLLADNLMDLSHEAYGMLVLSEPMLFPKHLQRRVDGEHVTVERIMPGCPAPPFYQKLKGYDGTIDRMHRIHFDPPATIMIESKSTPTASAEPDDGLEYRSDGAITPGRIIDAFLLGRATKFQPGAASDRNDVSGFKGGVRRRYRCAQPATGSVEPRGDGIGLAEYSFRRWVSLRPPGY